MTTSKSVQKLSELVSWLASPTKSALHLCKCVYVEPKGGILDEAEHESEVPQPEQNAEVVLEELTPRDTANLLVWRMFIRFVNDFMKTGAANDDLQHDPFVMPILNTVSLRCKFRFIIKGFSDTHVCRNKQGWPNGD